MNTTFRRSVVASALLAILLIIASGGLAPARGDRIITMSSISESIQVPDLSSSVPDTAWTTGPKPAHGDPDDPDAAPHFILLFMSRLFVLGR